MKGDHLIFVQAGFIGLTLICLFFIFYGAWKVLKKEGLAANETRARLAKPAFFLLTWLLLVSALSLTGFLADFSSFPPRLFLVLVVPLASIVLLLFNRRFQAFLEKVPGEWLMYIQFFRVPVELFLWMLFLDGITPVQMTFEGRNLDVLTGLTAPVTAILYKRFPAGRKGITLVWNLFGLALLVNILAVAILSMPVPFRAFMNEPANTAVAYFPIVLLPAVLVPLAYSMHFFSLKKEFSGK